MAVPALSVEHTPPTQRMPFDPDVAQLMRYRLRRTGNRVAVTFTAASDDAAIEKAFQLLSVAKLRTRRAFASAGGIGVYRLPDGAKIYPPTHH